MSPRTFPACRRQCLTAGATFRFGNWKPRSRPFCMESLIMPVHNATGSPTPCSAGQILNVNVDDRAMCYVFIQLRLVTALVTGLSK
eukprot:67722-Amphidinium_carterae.1